MEGVTITGDFCIALTADVHCVRRAMKRLETARILSPMIRRWPLAAIIDTAVASLLAVALLTEVWTFPAAVPRESLSVAALFVTLPLARRCRSPIIVAIVVAGGIVALDRISPDFSNNAAFNDASFMLALYSIGANTRGGVFGLAAPR